MRRGKNSTWGRFLAIVLAMTMVFQQAGITTLAEELATEATSEELSTDASVEASDSSTDAGTDVTITSGQSDEDDADVNADTSAEEAVDTSAGETLPEEEDAQDAAADSDSDAVQSEDSAEAATEAGEAESEAVSSEGETEEGTEAASDSEDTDAAEDGETESDTEAAEAEADGETEDGTEEETETFGTTFSATSSDSRVQVTATTSEAAELPEDAELVVDYIAPNSSKYAEAVEKIKSQLGSQLGLDEEGAQAAYVLYDVSFVCDGEEIEPNADVTVQMAFSNVIDLDINGEIVSKNVVHLIDDAVAEIVTDYVYVNDEGILTAFGFTQDDFSVVGAVVVSEPTEEETESESEEEDVTEEATEAEKAIEAETDAETETEAENEDESEEVTESVTEEVIEEETDETEEIATEAESETEEETQSESAEESETEVAEEDQTEEIVEGEIEKITESATEEETDAEENTEAIQEEDESAADVVEETTEAETETEEDKKEETEAPKTEFSYEDERVVITATATEEANLPQDAELVADYLDPDSDEYKAAVAAFNAQLSSELGADDENVVVEYTLYDIYFLCTSTGERIEPEEGNVTVTMSFITPVAAEADGEIVNIEVVHLKNDGEAEIVTDYVDTNSEGEVTSVGFTQNSFSIDGILLTSTSTTYSSDLNDFVTDMKIYVDGTEVSSSSSYSPSTEYKFVVYFAEESVSTRLAQTVTFTMPSSLIISSTSGTIYGSDNITVNGTYVVDADGNVVITFTDDFMAQADSGLIEGSFYFEATISESAIQDETTITIPDTDISKTITIITTPSLYAKKSYSYDSSTGIITYTLSVTADNGTVTNTVLTDTISNTLEIIDNEYTLTVGTSSPTTGTFSNGTLVGDSTSYEINIGTLDEGETATVTYSAKLSDDDIAKIQNGTITSVGNTLIAEGKNNGDDITSNDPTVDVVTEFKNTNWISKGNGTLVEENGKTYLSWSFTYNVDEKESVKGNTVTDTLSKNDYTQFKEGDVITVTRTDSDDNSTSFDIEVPSDGYTWSYVIGSNDSDSYTANEIYKYTFTYKTLVDTDELASLLGEATVSNTASDDEGHSASSTATLPGDITAPTKTFVTATEDKTSWKVTIKVPAGGLSIYLKDDSYAWDSSYNPNKVNIDSSSISVTVENNASATVDYYFYQESNGVAYFFFGSNVNSSNSLETNQANSFISNSSSDTITIVITYDTYNKLAETGEKLDSEWVVRNLISYGNWSTYVDSRVPGELKVEKSQISSYSYYDGTTTDSYSTGGKYITYQVVINSDRVDLGSYDVVVTDTHSENMSYVDDSAKLLRAVNTYYSYNNITNNGNTDECSWVSPDPEGEDVDSTTTVFNLGTLSDKYTDGQAYVYILYYTMEVDSSVLTSSEGVTLSNEASVSANEGQLIGYSDIIDYTYTNPLFDKSVITYPTKSNNYVATFQITVNGKYRNTSNQLVISDTWQNLVMDYESFKVTKNDTVINNYTVSTTKTGLTITIEDVTSDDDKYVITYNATVTGAAGTTITYSNTATVEGYEDKYQKEEKTVDKEQISGGTVTTNSYSLYVYKYDKDSATTGLSGAKFNITDASGNRLKKDDISTESNGETNIITLLASVDGNVFKSYTLYYLVETTAPEGYTLAEPIAFYFTDYTKSATELQAWLTSVGCEDAIALYSTNGVVAAIDVGDSRPEITITAKKTLSEKTLKDEQFSFLLQQVDVSGTVIAGGYSETVKNDADGNIEFSPISYTSKGTYYYTISLILPTPEIACSPLFTTI